MLVEGTGHCAVGSIVNVNNAKVASLLGASMVLIANGGLGTSNYADGIKIVPVFVTLNSDHVQ